MCLCLSDHIDAAPACQTAKASSDKSNFEAHSRSFSSRSRTLRASCCHSRARLTCGWLAGLTGGVEPSGSLRKVSDHIVIPFPVLLTLDSCRADLVLMTAALGTTGVMQTSGRPFPAVSFGYLSVECPFNKFYGINCCPKLGAKLLDRPFHRRRQVFPLVNNATQRFFDGSQHFLYCNFTVGSRQGAEVRLTRFSH